MDLTRSLVDLTSACSPVCVFGEVDLLRAFGRLHPIGVHFPIALALVAVAAEWWRVLARKHGLSALTLPLLTIAAISAIGASTTGWINAGYEHDADTSSTLQLHRWLGIASAVALCGLAAWCCRLQRTTARGATIAPAALLEFRVGALVLGAALGFTGHLGGELVHGEGHLTEWVFPVVANADESSSDAGAPAVALTMNEQFFLDEVRPVLAERCFECHGPRKQKGGLRFDSAKWLFNGEEEKWPVVPFDAEHSPLVDRVLLERTHPDTMPPEGEALTAEQIASLTQWINDGAAYPNVQGGVVGARGVSTAAMSAALGAAGTVAIGGVTQVEIAPAVLARAAEASKTLLARGVLVQPLAAESPLLDVNASRASPPLTDDEAPLLAALAPVVANLNLSKCALTDAGVKLIGSMPHLERLRFDGTGIGDAGVQALGSLPRLESINLVATKVSDASSEWLRSQPMLARVYVWQTSLDTPEAIKKLAGGTKLEVVGGSLPAAQPTTPPMPLEEKPAETQAKEPTTTP